MYLQLCLKKQQDTQEAGKVEFEGMSDEATKIVGNTKILLQKLLIPM